MKLKWPKVGAINGVRRRFLSAALASSGLAALGAARSSQANELRFPGDPVDHKVVYQFNKGDEEYHQHVLFSIGALLREYPDNVKIIVTCFGPGIHILAKNPLRPVSEDTKERVSSLSHYGVEFHACRNTMRSLKWEDKDMLPFAKVVEAGAADLMELQEQGYAYLSW
jgi:intracellular sulfur oxidation DsrE/DsrF family protein